MPVAKGEVYWNEWEEFSSGAVKGKYIVVLNTPAAGDQIAYAICTGTIDRYLPFPASPCIPTPGKIGFVVKKGQECFPEHTVIQVNQTQLAVPTDFERDIRYGRYKKVGDLKPLTVQQLLGCARKCKDHIRQDAHPYL